MFSEFYSGVGLFLPKSRIEGAPPAGGEEGRIKHKHPPCNFFLGCVSIKCKVQHTIPLSVRTGSSSSPHGLGPTSFWARTLNVYCEIYNLYEPQK